MSFKFIQDLRPRSLTGLGGKGWHGQGCAFKGVELEELLVNEDLVALVVIGVCEC